MAVSTIRWPGSMASATISTGRSIASTPPTIPSWSGARPTRRWRPIGPVRSPNAEGTETNQAMARRMHAYRKLVFSRSGRHKLTEWNNTDQVVATTDDELARYLANLKAQPGRDIHLSGGASFAQSVIALDLVDAFHFFVYPVVSPGTSGSRDCPSSATCSCLAPVPMRMAWSGCITCRASAKAKRVRKASPTCWPSGAILTFASHLTSRASANVKIEAPLAGEEWHPRSPVDGSIRRRLGGHPPPG